MRQSLGFTHFMGAHVGQYFLVPVFPTTLGLWASGYLPAAYCLASL